jgi:hypothetical protein
MNEEAQLMNEEARIDGDFEELVFPFRSLADQEDRIREFVRAHPISVVAGALVLGFAIARLIREA